MCLGQYFFDSYTVFKTRNWLQKPVIKTSLNPPNEFLLGAWDVVECAVLRIVAEHEDTSIMPVKTFENDQ